MQRQKVNAVLFIPRTGDCLLKSIHWVGVGIHQRKGYVDAGGEGGAIKLNGKVAPVTLPLSGNRSCLFPQDGALAMIAPDVPI